MLPASLLAFPFHRLYMAIYWPAFNLLFLSSSSIIYGYFVDHPFPRRRRRLPLSSLFTFCGLSGANFIAATSFNRRFISNLFRLGRLGTSRYFHVMCYIWNADIMVDDMGRYGGSAARFHYFIYSLHSGRSSTIYSVSIPTIGAGGCQAQYIAFII